MQLSLADESQEYREFVEKFKPKKTTDDCITPPEIYEVILEYVVDRYGIDRGQVVRPFWPGGDYERFEYPEGCVVVDNPPFSILSKIVGHYMARGIGFFLFAPTLTALSSRRHLLDINHIICHSDITYENGAVVNTSFLTNLDGDGTVAEAGVELSDIINAKNDELLAMKTKSLPKYEYPDHVLTAAKVKWFAAHHTHFKVNAIDCAPISKLDAMGDRGIFGGGAVAVIAGSGRVGSGTQVASVRTRAGDGRDARRASGLKKSRKCRYTTNRALPPFVQRFERKAYPDTQRPAHGTPERAAYDFFNRKGNERRKAVLVFDLNVINERTVCAALNAYLEEEK